ncbi:MAG: Bug family tripartite tricarboxylate transporter substrate binding protein [Alphaproteobacteria bacterium]
MKMMHCVLAGLLAFGLAPSASAAPFQNRDRINLVIGYEAGGGYDIYGRFVARHLSKHLTNGPTIVPQNMPGAGSLRAANFIYNVAPKDGTTIGTVSQSIALMQLLETPGLLFEVDKFSWIGRMSDVDTVLGVWHTAGVRSIADVKTREIAVAVGGALSGSDLYVRFLNALAGTKIKPIAGYSAKQAQLALEREEVHGSFSILFNQMKAQQPAWFSENKLLILVQIGNERRATLPNVPTLTELATNDEDRRMMAVISAGDTVGRTLIGPPDMQPDRLAELRRAFNATMADPEVLAEAAKMQLDINPLTGDKLQALTEEQKRLPPAAVARIKAIAESK